MPGVGFVRSHRNVTRVVVPCHTPEACPGGGHCSEGGNCCTLPVATYLDIIGTTGMGECNEGARIPRFKRRADRTGRPAPQNGHR